MPTNSSGFFRLGFIGCANHCVYVIELTFFVCETWIYRSKNQSPLHDISYKLLAFSNVFLISLSLLPFNTSNQTILSFWGVEVIASLFTIISKIELCSFCLRVCIQMINILSLLEVAVISHYTCNIQRSFPTDSWLKWGIHVCVCVGGVSLLRLSEEWI